MNKRANTIKDNSEDLQYILAYNTSPTIAYRPNHIGINTETFSNNNDEILVISDYNNYKKIVLKGVDINGN
jgi:hypothetical protein